jgi:tetratricopeptide (TPR) repeat protein
MSELLTRRLSLVGRHAEKERIVRAIRGEGSPILFLEGIAGIGKTILLEEAGRIAQEHNALCSPIVDFYDTEMHSHQALEAAVSQSLDPERKAFQGYWVRREQIERTLMPERKTLKEQQEELWGLFLQGYTTIADKQRVVLRFDTAERLEYERDSEEVLADCEVSPQDAPSWEWLLERIADLRNTAILIAARPTPTGLLKQSLLDTHKEKALYLEIGRFTPEETVTYFQATDFGKQVVDESPEMVGKVHLLTEGRPILIALALDWLERGTWEAHIYPASLEELKTCQEQAQVEEPSGRQGEAWRKWDEIKRNFEIALVQQIRSLDHTGLDMAVKYAALARKGCSTELLSRLMRITLEEARRLVDQLLTLSFVKPPRGPRQLFFLHDEMYDLVEKYIWLVNWPDYGEQARLDKIIIDWYTEQIETSKERIRACQDRGERADLRRQQQLLIAERLYYQYDEDPRIGYWEYSHLDEEAIGSREIERDILLRNEALWFTSHRYWRQGKQAGEPGYPLRDPAWMKNGKPVHSPAVDHDCRRRWVNRYIARNETDKAARIASKLLQKSKESPRPEEPELYRPGLQVALATAQAYMGGELTEAAIRNFEEGIQALARIPEGHREPWLYHYLLGTAHLYKGLALRNALWLKEAAQSYSQAIYNYRRIGYQAGLAEAMNNLAYIYARQGKPDRALAPCEDALRIREELGDEYPTGLNLNTKGIIFERHAFPEKACEFSQKALELFLDIKSERGIVLAEINLGRSLRRKGRNRESRQPGDFEKGGEYLADAVSRLEKWGRSREVFYEIEAYDEWGCLYRDWVAALYDWEEERSPQRLVPYLRLAVEKLEKARSLSKEEAAPERNVFQYVDATEDLARVYYWWARVEPKRREEMWSEALKLLQESEQFAEKIRDREEFYFLLGKTYLQFARIYREQGREENWEKRELAAISYAKAAGLLEKYSIYLPELRKTTADAADWLRGLGSAEEARRWITVMQATLRQNNLTSEALQEWIDDLVPPRLGVGWSHSGADKPSSQEEAHG